MSIYPCYLDPRLASQHVELVQLGLRVASRRHSSTGTAGTNHFPFHFPRTSTCRRLMSSYPEEHGRM